jgi:hypothetical protein
MYMYVTVYLSYALRRDAELAYSSTQRGRVFAGGRLHVLAPAHLVPASEVTGGLTLPF